MEIEVHSKRVELAEDLRRSAARKAERLGRYLAGMEHADVFFSNGQVGHMSEPVTCEVVIEGHGRVVRASAVGPRPEIALDLAVRKTELRLTRIKTKLVDRSRPKHASGPRRPGPERITPDQDEGEDASEGAVSL